MNPLRKSDRAAQAIVGQVPTQATYIGDSDLNYSCFASPFRAPLERIPQSGADELMTQSLSVAPQKTNSQSRIFVRALRLRY